MVMHARKLSRINDGFSEKHTPHGYENNSKYSRKYSRYGNSDKKDSPSANSLRSSPDSQSPRYLKSNYYKLKERDRERENRERDREREYRERDNSRSPKERRRQVRERERERTMHDRINSVHKKEEKERLLRVGDWSEHVSSSGKKYYYNCRTEVSQWEKPPEWLEWERNHRSSVSSLPSFKESSFSSVGIHRGQIDKSRQEKHSTLGESYRENRDLINSERERNDRDRRDYRIDDSYDKRENRKYVQEGATDMDISSGDSTPTSESHHIRCIDEQSSHNRDDTNSHVVSSNLKLHLGSSSQFTSYRPINKYSNSSGDILPTSSLPPHFSSPITSVGATTSSHNNNCGVPGTSSGTLSSNSLAVPQLLNSHPRLVALSADSAKSSSGATSSAADVITYSSSSLLQERESLSSINKPYLEPLTIAPNSNNIGVGPPTPTHSENQDGLDIRKVGSPNSSLNSLQSLIPSSTSSTSLSLTPSLANYYKETLISHIQGWPAEGIEKQCQRLSEESHTIGSIIMTKVSADLKMARSLVRLAEIQATLHEQRILFLRAQKRELEEMKSQNCFMNET